MIPLKLKAGDVLINKSSGVIYKVTRLQGNRVWCHKTNSNETDGYFHITHIMTYLTNGTYEYHEHLPIILPEDLFNV